MIVWTHAVLGVLYACVLYLCICACSVQLSMFHMEKGALEMQSLLLLLLSICLCVFQNVSAVLSSYLLNSQTDGTKFERLNQQLQMLCRGLSCPVQFHGPSGIRVDVLSENNQAAACGSSPVTVYDGRWLLCCNWYIILIWIVCVLCRFSNMKGYSSGFWAWL